MTTLLYILCYVQLHTTELQDGFDWGRLNLQSVTEESSFQEFLRTAELAGTEFQAEKMNISFVNPKAGAGLLSRQEKEAIIQKQTNKKEMLKIPRRPKWTEKTSAEELDANEKASFLEWRRGLAMLQENDGLLMTPYERNLEFWRQLWRVVERSDVVVQIVDARNPLQFRSEDLEKYVKEVGENKMNVVLVNKADLLTDQQREIWSNYFDDEKVRVVFFSAVLAAEELKAIDEEANNSENEFDDAEDDDTDDDNDSVKSVKSTTDALKSAIDKTEKKLEEIEKSFATLVNTTDKKSLLGNRSKVLTRDELILYFKSIHTGSKVTSGHTTVGLVGYPNVGKSSTINAIMTVKKVSVSATPGKTKHFQTLFFDDELLLCDCPGLVMPSFVMTKADMILNGTLPIDQMRDHVPPINLLCELIPRHILEDKYGIMIAKPLDGEDPTRPPYAEELLLAYGYNRGFMTANGQPDQSRSSRYILKDYVNGKLLYAYAPPNMPQSEYHIFPERIRNEVDPKSLPPREQRAIRAATTKGSVNELDSQFFKEYSHAPKIKGRSNFPHIRHPGSSNGTSTASGSIGDSNMSINTLIHGEKPWRANQKREKREKLRRKFSHLDQH